MRQQIFVNLVEFNQKSQILLNLKLKQKIVKFVKFLTASNPGHKWILPLLLTGEGLYSKIETERINGAFVDLRALMDVNFLGHLILMRVSGKGFFWR